MYICVYICVCVYIYIGSAAGSLGVLQLPFLFSQIILPSRKGWASRGDEKEEEEEIIMPNIRMSRSNCGELSINACVTQTFEGKKNGVKTK